MKCADCGVDGHKAGWTYCPARVMSDKPRPDVVPKKPWVKPTLTRWVKAESMDTPMDTISSGMDTSGYKYRDKEKRKGQMREYMRRVRGTPGG